VITFRCTQKVRNLLALHDRDLSDETDGDLQEWFVETATIERYRCLLFTHKLPLQLLGARRAQAGSRRLRRAVSSLRARDAGE
jgi:hypothetical protein